MLYERWGWRPLFFLGGAPALLALYVHLGVRESEVWKKTRHESWSALGRHLVKLEAVRVFDVAHDDDELRLARDAGYVPDVSAAALGIGPAHRAAIIAVSMVGAILGGLLFGMFSDRVGRRRAMTLALAGATLLVPAWAYAPSQTVLIGGAFLMQFMVQGAWGIIPAHLSELSPDSVRGFLPGFAYQCGAAGGICRVCRGRICSEDALLDCHGGDSRGGFLVCFGGNGNGT